MIALTLLNRMASNDFGQTLDRHIEWGLTFLDLKDSVFGKRVVDLTDDEGTRAQTMIRGCGLSVYCFSTQLFEPAIELGEEVFRQDHLGKINHTIEIAHILQPRIIRLLAAQTIHRSSIKHSVDYLKDECPWVLRTYAEAIDRIYDAGFHVTIENETGQCILSNTEEILTFFSELDRLGMVSFTWDVQNLWEAGQFPSVAIYKTLKDLICYYHLKGGQHNDTSKELYWKSSVQDASWPVVEITREVVATGTTPVICLNGSHGGRKKGYDYTNIVRRDIDFIRDAIPEIE